MKIAYLSIFVLALGCKTAGPTDSQVAGGPALGAYQNMTGANTDEEREAVTLKRVADINRYTSSGVAATPLNCPIAKDDPCAVANIVIEFEPPGSGSVGHTALALSGSSTNVAAINQNYLFYDFGPGRDVIEDSDGNQVKIKVGDPGILALPQGSFNGLFSGVPGTQWWDNPWIYSTEPPMMSPSQIGFQEVLSNIDALAEDYSVLRVPICVTKAHAALMNKYWVETYANMPTYMIPGSHCTSMVAHSYEGTYKEAKRMTSGSPYGTFDPRRLTQYVPDIRGADRSITSPTKYAERVLGGNYSSAVDYRHECGSLKGQNPRAIMIKNNPGFEEPKIKALVKWTTDESHP